MKASVKTSTQTLFSFPVPALFFVLAFAITASIALAAPTAVTIAVIDSGTDVKHEALSPRVWIDPGETANNYLDDDFDGFIDDIYGWNFVDNNNQIFDYKYLNFFNQDYVRFFEIQGKLSNGTATSDEISWIKEKIKDQDFLNRGMAFGNFIHGTHVAGISVNGSLANNFLAIKIIATEVNTSKLNANSSGESSLSSDDPIIDDYKEGVNMGLRETALAQFILKRIAKRQMEEMGAIAEYLSKHNIRVANGSFGTGFKQGASIVRIIYKELLQQNIDQNELIGVTLYFFQQLVHYGEEAFGKSPNTLFVFAAGNDGTDNDVIPSTPTNIKIDNVISVAATKGTVSLAKFSNYGRNMVDVAAPGVAITSSIPDNRYLALSGTSQASPMVANIAAEIVSANPNLTPLQIKKILIQTVDYKLFLDDIIASSGIVNKQLAVRAAQLSTSDSLENAIADAKKEVKSVKSMIDNRYRNTRNISDEDHSKLEFVLPLPSVFSLMGYDKQPE